MGSIGRYSALGKMSVVLQRAYLAYAGAYCIGYIIKSIFSPCFAVWEDWVMPVEGSTQSEQGVTYLRLPYTIFLSIITVQDNDYPEMIVSGKSDMYHLVQLMQHRLYAFSQRDFSTMG